MSKFRKKLVVVEAEQWFPKVVDGFVFKGDKFVNSYMLSLPNKKNACCQYCEEPLLMHGKIKTLEGVHIVCPGDWIITGVKGERYPCKPDIFEATYEKTGE